MFFHTNVDGNTLPTSTTTIIITIYILLITVQTSYGQDLWTVDKTRLGQRPDCEGIKVKPNANQNYLWQTTEKCKEKCVAETSGKCNYITRYQQYNKNDNSLWHCWFYTCPDPNNVSTTN